MASPMSDRARRALNAFSRDDYAPPVGISNKKSKLRIGAAFADAEEDDAWNAAPRSLSVERLTSLSNLPQLCSR